jgi:diketogulonate reductase-like aldo/keto reductase
MKTARDHRRKTMDEYVELNRGLVMPKIGLGTYDLKKEKTKEIVLMALELGYRHIETAPIYLNEKEIGSAIEASGLDRDELFITSKVPPHIKTFKGTLRIAKRTMDNLGVDYLDALLINNPVPWGKEGEDYAKENLDVWRAMESLYEDEVVAAIGVSNFTIEDLEKLLPETQVRPRINQLGIFIGHTLDDLREYCQQQNIIVQAHSPLARGRLLELKELSDVGNRYRQSPARIALRYVLAKGAYPIVKASSKTHLQENLVYDLVLPQGWDVVLDRIDQDVRDYKPPQAKYIL